jgi:hypothetical protein
MDAKRRRYLVAVEFYIEASPAAAKRLAGDIDWELAMVGAQHESIFARARSLTVAVWPDVLNQKPRKKSLTARRRS